jgi:hypothetical protein
MDTQTQKVCKNPYESANPFSKLFFWWMIPLFRKGFSGDISRDDVPNAPIVDKASSHGLKLEKYVKYLT